MTQFTTVVWFRQDLRLRDNPALIDACSHGDILPIYILDETNTPAQHRKGAASKWWLYHSLARLNEALEGKLQILTGDPSQLLCDIIGRTGISRIVWNRCYEPWQMQRDKAITAKLQEQDCEVLSFNGALLWEPWRVLKQDNTPYQVFTPFYKNGCLQLPDPRMPRQKPRNLAITKSLEWRTSLDSLELIPDIPWYRQFAHHWTPGEDGAADKLSWFLKTHLEGYKRERDIPAAYGTSHLSPHLHFGELSPNQVWYAALNAMEGNSDDKDLACFLSEIGWREFCYYQLFHFPKLQTDNFKDKYNAFAWRQNGEDLKKWQQGKTGVPIVDAGMREMWQTGYMHNRVRMIVASFLVKNLLLDWREGERWFWDCLVDADMANNCANWQWVAGCGADAAPYFRIFNPVLQGEKFDSEGEYVSKYCPELKQLPKKYIHSPWRAPKDILKQAGVVLGQTYPAPMVDLKASRQRALDTYRQLD